MDDLISRQAAIKQILLCENHDMEHDFEFNQGLIASVNAVAELPNIDPVKHGRWESLKQCYLWRCPNCENVIYSESPADRIEFHSFCGRCGMKMDGGENDE